MTENQSEAFGLTHEETISSDEALKLDNQLCFALYVCSKEIIRKYKPLLEPLHLTYTGYIAMLALWEKDDVTVKELGERLTLDSGTLTPLLKKLERLSYIDRIRSSNDERNVHVRLTNQGRALKKEAAHVPEQMICSVNMEREKAIQLWGALHELMNALTNG